MHIQNGITSDNMPLNALVEALFAYEINVKAMRDVTRGGLATILNEICDSAGLGAIIEEAAVPVSAQTAALCGILGLDPLTMGNEGKFIAVVDGKDAKRALEALKGNPGGERAAVIGQMVSGSGVTVRTTLGGQRKIGPLIGEGLPRIC
jgi:hydrogenase expression/formation protein HypE